MDLAELELTWMMVHDKSSTQQKTSVKYVH